ncbi:GNAT family N-acetyltransferase [Thalassobacillus sp. CUG 92003]|uniref:GNAT family N-acetyltransferase n=1 Tax=Thalassobacillus sp. CUG 92003 TaxID=2736641 RepID=UPI00351A4BEA
MTINIRSYQSDDFDTIQSLNSQEGWSGLVSRYEATRQAFEQSSPVLVVEYEGEVIAYLRALTDQIVTLYVSEVLVREDWRGHGIGKLLLKEAHRLYPDTRIDMLATSQSQTYYTQQQFRPFYGFRKSAEEWN